MASSSSSSTPPPPTTSYFRKYKTLEEIAAESYTTPPAKFDDLPVMRMRKKIVEKILENRVTLIVGETGCGKSSQIPQFLLEENMEPILCTQPRRFAVVAVARTVAKARNSEVGEEVGYHIGHSKVYSARSKIIFKTAGVLLEEMRDKGFQALKYKAIILDEVHERSVESDLVLVCVKQFLLKDKDLRVVLMSATADIGRYKEYFKDLGKDERVEVLAIPPSTDQNTVFQRKVLYLEQVTDLLGIESDDLSMEYCSAQSPRMADATIKEEVHKLIHKLVMHIHQNELDMQKSILVFLPTYYSLEQQWFLLKPFRKLFDVHILHSSIDIEQALKSMRISEFQRKVILATNIAESSVTIPKVGYVIDSCRSLQVYWDNARKADSATLAWVSKSQAEQRKGRTGRTCEGDVYRLVTGPFFSQLEEYEPPSILNLSLRQQVLHICCAEYKSINDPKLLLQKALDPPEPEVIQDSLDLLVKIGALEKASPRGRYEPTFYGRLLASFSLSFDASVLILKFGELGMLREGILLGCMMDIQPLPVLRPFGRESLYLEYLSSYYSGDSKYTGLTGKKELVYVGNFCAFQFWQRVFKDKYRLERLKQLFRLDGIEDWKTRFPKIEEDWCSIHYLVQSSLQQAADTYDEILSSLHRYRPNFLVESDGRRAYSEQTQFQHSCLVMYEQNRYFKTLEPNDEHDSGKRNCVQVPFLAANHYEADEIARNFADMVKEMRMEHAEEIPGNFPNDVNVNDYHAAPEAPLCKYYLSGSCNRGSQCSFSHSSPVRMPVCKFFFSLQGCRNGNSCSFSHDVDPSAFGGSSSSVCWPANEDAEASSLLRLFPKSSDGCILILDDTDSHFSSYLSSVYDSSRIIATTSTENCSDHSAAPGGVRILWGLSHPYQTIMSRAVKNTVPWKKIKCILWFPRIDSENCEGHRSLIQTFFEYLAIRVVADAFDDVKVILTMNNLRFCQLQVEKLATECFFVLKQSFPFHEQSLGELFDDVTTKKPMMVSRAISYVFEFHPPPYRTYDYKVFFRHNLRQLEQQEYVQGDQGKAVKKSGE